MGVLKFESNKASLFLLSSCEELLGELGKPYNFVRKVKPFMFVSVREAVKQYNYGKA